MFAYGKTAANAIAILSCLATQPPPDPAHPPLTASHLARRRHLSRALAARLLAVLAKARLVAGTPGPKGGYWLARPPATIRLADVVRLFEQTEPWIACPFGRRWCGKHGACPLHDRLQQITDTVTAFLDRTTLAVFLPPAAAPEHPSPAASHGPPQAVPSPRSQPKRKRRP